MLCKCGSSTFAIVDNYNTCLECGNCAEYAPTMTFSYNHPCSHRLRAYYCRVKRFKQYVFAQKQQLLYDFIDEILDLYNYVEFFWGVYKKTRKYFFSRKVMLFFIVERLGLDIKVPLLKDQVSNISQLESIVHLLSKGSETGMHEPKSN
jgi:hypothetical protein